MLADLALLHDFCKCCDAGGQGRASDPGHESASQVRTAAYIRVVKLSCDVTACFTPLDSHSDSVQCTSGVLGLGFSRRVYSMATIIRSSRPCRARCSAAFSKQSNIFFCMHSDLLTTSLKHYSPRIFLLAACTALVLLIAVRAESVVSGTFCDDYLV